MSETRKTAAFIPVRGGSKSIPLKNIKMLNGHPLVYWTVKAACECRYIDEVYVSTDSEEIKDTVEAFRGPAETSGNRGEDPDGITGVEKLRVIGRSPETCTDTASTESAMLEFAGNVTDWDNIVLIQATSPLLRSEDLDRGMELFMSEGTDSVFSGVRKKQFLWHDDGEYAAPTYDPLNRPRRQDYQGYIVENGAFYITGREQLFESGCRMSGRTKVCEMSESAIYEIDEPEDFIVMEAIMKNR
ncbi:MAG: acylneuraminate cytidylyltransferase family protein [Lachnospiraceae bacterium]|nr:acylneuraminate cytidylyltransferase family protein [Lachnospiraceae bacterium]